ncbi:hypothetical protein CHCC5027_1054 [Bacillus paralicheniformis]|nr:hypothetical protein CHCC5027_1054 [Bacillus paralicheniformis]
MPTSSSIIRLRSAVPLMTSHDQAMKQIKLHERLFSSG